MPGFLSLLNSITANFALLRTTVIDKERWFYSKLTLMARLLEMRHPTREPISPINELPSGDAAHAPACHVDPGMNRYSYIGMRIRVVFMTPVEAFGGSYGSGSPLAVLARSKR